MFATRSLTDSSGGPFFLLFAATTHFLFDTQLALLFARSLVALGQLLDEPAAQRLRQEVERVPIYLFTRPLCDSIQYVVQLKLPLQWLVTAMNRVACASISVGFKAAKLCTTSFLTFFRCCTPIHSPLPQKARADRRLNWPGSVKRSPVETRTREEELGDGASSERLEARHTDISCQRVMDVDHLSFSLLNAGGLSPV